MHCSTKDLRNRPSPPAKQTNTLLLFFTSLSRKFKKADDQGDAQHAFAPLFSLTSPATHYVAFSETRTPMQSSYLLNIFFFWLFAIHSRCIPTLPPPGNSLLLKPSFATKIGGWGGGWERGVNLVFRVAKGKKRKEKKLQT